MTGPAYGLVCLTVGPELRFRTVTLSRYRLLTPAERETRLRALYAENIAAAARLRAALREPEEGIEVIATGRLTTFPGQSKYQMIVDQIEPAGAGALMAMLEQRRKVLAAEGLFDAAAKRPIPYLPDVIAVVTSPTGAVIRDILHRLRDRFPSRVLIWPVAVQGDGCAPQAARITWIADRAEFTPPVIYSREARQKLVYMVEAAPEAPSTLKPGQTLATGPYVATLDRVAPRRLFRRRLPHRA